MVPLPNVTPPLVIVMVPVGPAGTEAVFGRGLPKLLGGGVFLMSVGVVFGRVWFKLGRKGLYFPPHLWFPEMRSLPRESFETVGAAPPPVTVEVPRVVEPLVNVTV